MCSARPVVFDTISGDLYPEGSDLSDASRRSLLDDAMVNAGSSARRHKACCAFVHHAEFPGLPERTPFTYVKTMGACLSEDPLTRPGFAAILQLLDDLEAEIASGEYMNSSGAFQVWAPRKAVVLPCCHAVMRRTGVTAGRDGTVRAGVRCVGRRRRHARARSIVAAANPRVRHGRRAAVARAVAR
jgi:hypothetical protein